MSFKFLRLIFLFIIFIISLIFNIAFADEYHYNNILIGDRASGMGGAYTAISDDPTGMYYNPAGIMYSTMRNLSASVNAYYNLTKKYKGVIGGHGWERTSSSLLPNYFGIIQPLGKLKVGFSYAVPDSMQEDQDQTFCDLPLDEKIKNLNPGINISKYTINFNNDDNTYNFGPSIAAEITEDLSAGITLYVHHRRSQLIFNQFLKTSDTINDGYEWINQYSETSEWGIRPILGIMWAPVKQVSIGLAISKTMLFDSDTTGQMTYRREGIWVDTNNDGIRDDIDNNGIPDIKYTPPDPKSTDIKRKYPLQLNTGVAYFASPKLLIAGDVSYYSKVDDSTFGNREAVLNAAIGTEYYMNKNWAMRAGLFTNMANTHEVKSSASGQPEHIDLYGGSLSLSRFTKNTSVTLGGNMSYGTGKAQVISGSSSIQDASALAWTLFISSSYSY